VHWRRTRPPRWRRRAAVNGLGALITAVATLVFLLTKFTEGAWVVVVAVPAFMLLFVRIRAYYERVAELIGLDTMPEIPAGKRTVVVVPVTAVSKLTKHAITEALSIGQEVVAVTVVLEDAGARDGPEHAAAHTTALQRKWEQWHPGVPLYVLHTEFASVVDPIVTFIDDLRASHADDQIVVLIPVLIPDRIRYRLLHNQIDVVLSSALRTRTDLIVARVTMPLETTAPAGKARESISGPSAPGPAGSGPPESASARTGPDGKPNFS